MELANNGGVMENQVRRLYDSSKNEGNEPSRCGSRRRPACRSVAPRHFELVVDDPRPHEEPDRPNSSDGAAAIRKSRTEIEALIEGLCRPLRPRGIIVVLDDRRSELTNPTSTERRRCRRRASRSHGDRCSARLDRATRLQLVPLSEAALAPDSECKPHAVWSSGRTVP